MFFRKKKNIDVNILPRHIGIIMDGNGRWAKKRGLPRSAGHIAGASNFKKITIYCSKIGIKFLTVYAFSTENWKRPEDEISALMKLFKEYLEEALNDFKDENIKVIFIGDVTAFSEELQDLIRRTEKESSHKNGMTLCIAMNYGGRDEIVRACKKISEKVLNNEINIEEISEKMISSFLYTNEIPDPDLIIRPSGEYRTSNFLLWQSAYSEYVIMNILWPDFKPKHLDEALREYANRNRRFGGI